MQSLKRKPFQGVLNVVKFNWHFYVLGLCVVIVLLFLKPFLNYFVQTLFAVFILLLVVSIFISLITTFYLYDYSGFYNLNWLNNLNLKTHATVINIHAGFDETSEVIQHKFSPIKFIVLDFYDPAKHTKISIKRARKNGTYFPGTKTISTINPEIELNDADYIFLLLAAHEIRNTAERISFFKQLHSSLKTGGRIIVAEHLRNVSNFIAYNVGAFHFFSKHQWKSAFTAAGIDSSSEIKINSFITAFILEKNENPA